MNVDGHTKQLGIIGFPVEHSFSPAMHNYISEITGNNYTYSAWCVKPGSLKEAIEGIRALGIWGVNVTAPYKKEVMQYLDRIEKRAEILGSVNTVVNKDGILWGYNTDADGFIMLMEKNGIQATGKRILILGAGGVVKPVLIRILQLEPDKVVVVNRTVKKAEDLCKKVFEETGLRSYWEIDRTDFDIVINMTSAGMAPQEDKLPTSDIDGIDNLDFINSDTAVIDMIYNPEETLFLKEAKKRGAKTLNGLGMLIYQGIIAYELFTDTKLDDDIYYTIEKEVFKI